MHFHGVSLQTERMRKKMRQKLRLIIVIGILLVMSLPVTMVMASEFNFSVSTVIPDNQIDKNQSYFDLLMEPSQKQILEVELRNDTAEDITVLVGVNSATTNVNGVVEYSSNGIEPDETLLYNMSDLVTTEDEVVIPANSTYTLELEVNMPAEEFDGILAGGITFQEVEDKEDSTAEEETAGMSIKNEYAYVVAILLRQNENDITPNLELNDVYPNQINARNIISANIQNTESMYMNKMTVEAKVTKKGQTEALYESSSEGLQMAPNSNFSYPILLNGEKMEGGEYTLHLTAVSMGEEWTWTKDFTIDSEVAKEYNESDVTILEETDYSWLIYVAVGIGILFLSIIFWLLLLLRRKKDKE